MTIHFHCTEAHAALLNENAGGATRQAQCLIKRCIKLAHETWERNKSFPMLRNGFPDERTYKITIGFTKKEYYQLTDLEYVMQGFHRDRVIYACISTYLPSLRKGI